MIFTSLWMAITTGVALVLALVVTIIVTLQKPLDN